MADGLNEARALRVTELMRDFQAIQQKIAAFNPPIPSAAASEPGYVVIRQCKAEARELLNKPPPVDMPSKSATSSSDESAKRTLQRVILDASARRFRAQKIYQRAIAAMKWINARAAFIHHGSKPTSADQPKLQAIGNTLRQEIAGITDQRIYTGLRSKDQTAGFWLAEDPAVSTVTNYIKAHA